MKYKLMAVDMDGTLLNSNSEITNETLQSIKKAVNKGLYFVLSTGGSILAVNKYVKQAGLDNMPLITHNGARIYYNGELVFDLTLPKNLAKQIAREGRKRNASMIAWAKDVLYTEKNDHLVQQYKSISNVEPIVVDNLGNVDSITKFVWFGTEQSTNKNFAELKDKFNGKVNLHPSRKDFLEFVNINCSKATALQLISKYTSVKIEEMIAVGDGYNDLSMIELAGLGVAMENAPEQVKNKADLVALSNDNNGVNRLIRDFLLNNED